MDATQENALLKAAVLQWLRYERQSVVLCCERAPATWFGVPDVLALTPRRTLVEVEVKRTLADFKANDSKRCLKLRAEGHGTKPEQFYFCVPPSLVERVLPLLPAGAGLLTLAQQCNPFSGVNSISVVRGAENNAKQATKLSPSQIVQMLKCQSGTLVTAMCRVYRLEEELRARPAVIAGGTSSRVVPPRLVLQRAALHQPPDFWQANREWKANCGPSAFAALNAVSLAVSRQFFPHFPAKPWTSMTHMRAALLNAGHTVGVRKGWPDFGVALVMWTYTRRKPSMSSSHWIAVEQIGKHRYAYDCNAGAGNGGWARFDEWHADTAKHIADQVGATGYVLHRAFAVR